MIIRELHFRQGNLHVISSAQLVEEIEFYVSNISLSVKLTYQKISKALFYVIFHHLLAILT